MPKTTPKKNNTGLETAIKDIKSRFGDGAIMRLNEKDNVNIGAISSGSIGLDNAMGIGGYPKGRIIEISGPESSGKTTLALHAVAESQKKGGVCAFIDVENAMDPQYSERLGVNIEKLLISQPGCGEEALEIVESLVRSGDVELIVVDSVAALTTKDEIEGEMGATHIGKLARLMSLALKKLNSLSAKKDVTIIFINQIRANIGAFGFGNNEITPGGKALKFYTSVRLDVRRIAQLKKGDEVVGGRVKVKVVKNKVARPFRLTEFDLMYNEGISKEGEMLSLGEKFKIISKSGSTYTYLKNDEKLGVGYQKAKNYLKENKELSEEIINEINENLKNE